MKRDSMFRRPIVLLATACFLFGGVSFALAEPAAEPAPAEPKGAAEPDEKNSLPPLGKFLTVTSPVDDVVFGRVTNAALSLQNEAVNERRRAVLVLEITPGSSQFHQIDGLARFLTSAQLSKVTTVAWIPETVTGNNVVLALACNEIVMHPDAELGDIGHGQTLDRDEQQHVLSLVEKRRNRKVSPALALGLMDPQRTILRVKLQPGPDAAAAEVRVVTPEDLRLLQDSKAAILDVQTIKEAGAPGIFSGSKARALDVLIVQTATARGELVDLYHLPAESQRETVASGDAPRVHLIRVDHEIEPVLEAFLERQIQRAISSGANMIIFEIDSLGGLLIQSQNLAFAIADLDPKEVRTVAYVPEKAISGAAIIALGCDEIYMRDGAKIGDAGPIEIRHGQQFEFAPQKALDLLQVTMKTLAEKKGRPTAILQAMVNKDLQAFQVTHRETGRVWYMTEAEINASDGVWIKGPAVPETGNNHLLTVDAQRAHDLKLAEPIVADLDDLKQRLGIPVGQQLVAAGRTWVDTLIFVLNSNVALFVLIFIGIVCVYLELHLMTGLLGIISALCFAIFFWSRFLGGTAGWLEIVLFLLGAICLGLEIFVLPGFGVFGVSGALLLFASLVLASQTWGNATGGDIDSMSRTIGTLSASLVSVVIMAMLLGRFLPHIPIFNQMILTPPGMAGTASADGPRLRPDSIHEGAFSPFDRDRSLIGHTGVAVSILRPAGKAQIAGRFVDVVSEGPYIAQGSLIEVIEITGNRVVVREV